MIAKVKIQNGTRTADIAEGISWSLVREIDSDTWEISAPEYEAEQERKASRAVNQLVIAERILEDKIPIDRIPEFAAIFDMPEAGRKYPKDWILREELTNEIFVLSDEVEWAENDRLDEQGTGASKREWAENKRANEGEIWIFEEDNFVPKVAHVTEKGKEPTKAPNIWDKL
jgi:hypothetical protein